MGRERYFCVKAVEEDEEKEEEEERRGPACRARERERERGRERERERERKRHIIQRKWGCERIYLESDTFSHCSITHPRCSEYHQAGVSGASFRSYI